MRRFLAIFVVLTAGCAAPSREAPPGAPSPAPAPETAILPFERWDVDASRLEIRVYRDGPMQKLGHNHVIVSDSLEGVVQLREPLPRSGFDVALPLDSLVVDDPAARATAGTGFEAPVPPQDREATRRNLLGEGVLDAAKQPVLRLTAAELSGVPGAYQARVRVALRGEEHAIMAPFAVTIEGGRLRARSSIRLTHAELGLKPFTVALGALRVRDDIDIELTLEARRAS